MYKKEIEGTWPGQTRFEDKALLNELKQNKLKSNFPN